jgi:LysM repeat protein
MKVAASLFQAVRCHRGTAFAAVSMLLVSCSTTKKDQAGSGEYASYPNDGKYHPYNQSGTSTTNGPLPYPNHNTHYEEYTPSSNSTPEAGIDSGGSSSSSSSSSTSKKKKKSETSTSSKTTAKKTDDDTSSTGSEENSKPKTKSKTKPKAEASSSASSSSDSFTHTVKKGETLTSMAKKYGTTVSAIKKANHKTEMTVHAGQKIKIPN